MSHDLSQLSELSRIRVDELLERYDKQAEVVANLLVKDELRNFDREYDYIQARDDTKWFTKAHLYSNLIASYILKMTTDSDLFKPEYRDKLTDIKKRLYAFIKDAREKVNALATEEDDEDAECCVVS